MKLTYDSAHNVAYLRFRPEAGEVESRQITDDLVIDIAPDGTLFGIELLNANEQLALGDDGEFVFVDPMTGEERSLKVA